ncbi:hypothetical protein RUM44_007324 [Polyplax serrata]|uniref:Uncharacterized protein n=1 Tax=Polyplax serrata TaxID=468196 RepID=A0ABR1B0C9_POLSC
MSAGFYAGHGGRIENVFGRRHLQPPIERSPDSHGLWTILLSPESPKSEIPLKLLHSSCKIGFRLREQPNDNVPRLFHSPSKLIRQVFLLTMCDFTTYPFGQLNCNTGYSASNYYYLPSTGEHVEEEKCLTWRKKPKPRDTAADFGKSYFNSATFHTLSEYGFSR